MRKIKLLGALALLMAAACLLSSCKLGMEFFQAYMEARETEEIPARETAPAGWNTPAPPTKPPVVPTAPPTKPPAAPTAPPTKPPAVPTAPPEDEAVQPTPVEEYFDEYFYGPGWFETVMGAKFYLPEGFVQQSNEGRMQAPGTHTYVFLNNELGLEIDVFECTLLFLPVTPEEDYQIMSSQDGVTYATAGNGWYVVSGYFDAKNIYYTKVNYDETFYHSVSFYYPTVTSDACEEILLEFLRNYSTD